MSLSRDLEAEGQHSQSISEEKYVQKQALEVNFKDFIK